MDCSSNTSFEIPYIAGERLPFLKLEPSRSYLKPGDSIEVDCASSLGTTVPVKWQKLGGATLPKNMRVRRFKVIIK
jgi:hypothetical protein